MHLWRINLENIKIQFKSSNEEDRNISEKEENIKNGLKDDKVNLEWKSMLDLPYKYDHHYD